MATIRVVTGLMVNRKLVSLPGWVTVGDDTCEIDPTICCPLEGEGELAAGLDGNGAADIEYPGSGAAEAAAALVGDGAATVVDVLTGSGEAEVAVTLDGGGSGYDIIEAEIVISQVYGGSDVGSGSTFNRDFVELYNRGTTAVDLTGWSIQWATATGTSWSSTTLDGAVIEAEGFLLIQIGDAAAFGAELPVAPDVVGLTSPRIGINGKLVLVRGGPGFVVTGADPTPDVSWQFIQDFIGFGTADHWEGTTAAGACDDDSALWRIANGLAGGLAGAGGENSSDFFVALPAPRNSLTIRNRNTVATATITPTVDGDGSATVDAGAATAAFRAGESGGGFGDFVCNKPTGTAENDILIAVFDSDNANGDITAPSGWTHKGEYTSGDISGVYFQVYEKMAGGSEPASYTWTFASGSYSPAGFIAAISGATSTQYGTGNTGSDSSPVASSITMAGAGTVICVSCNSDAFRTWTKPTGYTLIYALGRVNGGYEDDVSSGSTGTITSSLDMADYWISFLIGVI